MLQRLRYFALVAEEGSLKRGAAKLRLAQPALSRQLKSLEGEVGATLFERDHRGVQLTAAGAALLDGVRDVMSRLSQGVRRTQQAHQGSLGRVRVGLSRVAVDSSRIGSALVAVREQYPEVKLVVTEIAPFAEAVALRGGDLDVVIGFAADDNRRVTSLLLYDDAIDSVLIARSHGHARKDTLHPDDLRDIPLLVVRNAIERLPNFFADLRNLGVSWEEVDSIDTVFGMVVAGLGWAAVPGSLRNAPPHGTAVIPLVGLKSALPMMLRWRSSESSALIGNFVDLISRRLSGSEARARKPARRATPPRLRALPHGLNTDLRLVQLRSFVAALDEHSLTEAAERLGLTQSGISRQIRALESALGCVLLQRDSHGIIATSAGEIFRDEATAILELVDAAISRSQRAARGHEDSCIIGSLPPELTSGIVLRSLRVLAERHPSIEIELREMTTTTQIAALQSGVIDIGVAGSQPTTLEDPSIESVRLVDDPIECILVPQSHPLASRAWVRAPDLAEYPFVFCSRPFSPRLYDLVTQSFAQLGLASTPTGAADGIRALWRLTADMGGWTPGTRSSHSAPPAGLVSIPVEGLSIPWGIRLLWRRDRINPPAREVLDVLRETRSPAA